MRAYFTASLFSLLLITGCVSTQAKRDLIPYTQALRVQHNLSNQEVQRLQYYLSDTVLLQRQDASGGHRVVDGRLLVTDDRNLERVIIEQGVPGIATGVYESALDISFAEGSSLAFTQTGRNPAAPYRLHAKPDANGYQYVYINNAAYGVAADQQLPYLLIDREQLYRSTQETYRLPGRTLNQY